MTTGRYSSGPFRSGKTRDSISDLAISDMLADLGSSYSDDSTSTVVAELIQYAKAIEILFRSNNKLGNLYQPQRLTSEVIERWSKALNVRFKANASIEDKKAAIAAKLAVIGTSATYQGVSDLLRTIAPNTFQGITNTDWKHAHSSVTGGVDVGGGVYIPTDAIGYWSSVHHVAVKLAQPASMNDTDFYAEAYNIRNFLDDFLPAWTTFDWYRDVSPFGFSVVDEANPDLLPVNLDNSRLALGDYAPFATPGQSTSFTDSMLPCQLSLNRRGIPCVYYHVHLSAPLSLRIDMTSGSFDCFLYLSAGTDLNATVIASNEDASTLSTNSHIGLDHLPAGDYLIECTMHSAPFAGDRPSYVLTIST